MTCLYYLGDRGMLDLKRTTDLGKTIKTVASKIFSFGLGGRFLFASVMTGKVSLKYILFKPVWLKHPRKLLKVLAILQAFVNIVENEK